MRQPQLSATQFAYLFQQEAFLERLEQRARCLAEDGYSVEVTETPYVFLVLCPKRVNAYRVHAIEQTCTCPFMTRQADDEPLTPDGSLVLCKHLLGLKRLLKKTRERLLQEDECEAYRLWAHAMAWRAIERLREEDNPAVNANAVAAITTKGEKRREHHPRHEPPELSRRTGPGSGR